MALISEAKRDGLTPRSEIDSRKADEAKRRKDDSAELTPEEQEKYQIIRYCARLLDDARKARQPFDTFDMCWDLFIGNVWTDRRPPWRANITINKVRAFITFMQAVMTDNKPRNSIEPEVEGSEDAADLLRKLVDRDWDENDMQNKLSLFVQHGLIWGTGFMKLTYDPFANNGRGKHVAVNVPPSRVYVNRGATTINDWDTPGSAEYIIHVEDMTMGWIRRNFPTKANAVNKVRGLRIKDRTEQDRDHVNEGWQQPMRILSAMNINGNIVQPQIGLSRNQQLDENLDLVEVAEYWLADDSIEPYQRQVVKNGVAQTQPVIKDGEYVMEVVGQRPYVSEIDGATVMIPVRRPKTEPVMETAWRRMFPNGRLVLIAAGRVLLRDIPNPFQTDGFPWAMWKDYDVGAFWGQGEPLALRSCSLALNRIASSVFEILEKTGNPSYKLAKDAGLNAQYLRGKPGQVLEMDNIEGLKPLDRLPPPAEYFELFKLVSESMSEVAGVNPMHGQVPSNTGFQAIDSLQESDAAPLRLKVRNMESGIVRMGKLRIQLIQQWDQGQRPLRIEKNKIPGVVDPAAAVAVEFRKYTNEDLKGQMSFKVVPVSSLSTSPSGTWNKWMMMLDKHLIDRRWWHDRFRVEGYKTELPRLEKQEQQDKAMEAAAKPAGKPGPAPSKPARQAHRATAASPNQAPSRADNAVVR